ncbi:hypothetical protein Tco_0647446 [Tanacetum coccineum]
MPEPERIYPESTLLVIPKSLVANVVKRGTTKEAVKEQVLLVVGLLVDLCKSTAGHLLCALYKSNLLWAIATTKATQRAASQPASASACTPKPTRQTKTKNVAASGSHGAKKTPTRQSQRQKAAKKTQQQEITLFMLFYFV